MKKNLLFVLTFILMLFMMPKVNATVNYLEESSCKSMLYEGRLTGIDCNVRFKVTEKASTYNRVTLRITMPNDFLINSNTVEAGPGWRIVSRNDETHTYTLESDETSFAPGSYQLFRVTSYGSSNSNNCDSSLKVIPETIVRKCVKSGDVYYDRDGNVTTELEYEKQCKTHKCEILSDGTRYGKEGTVVTELEYEKQCKVHKCEVLSDGTYYDKDGNVSDKLTYEKQCIVHKCEILSDGTRYGKEGTVVTELEYEKQCKKHTCEILSDGTRYGKEGTVVTELEYEKQCKSHQCEILSDGTRYGKNGTIVDEETYNKECNPKVPVCEIKDDKYYDDEGKETSKEEYEKKCKKHTCEILSDGTRYGKNGTIVDEETYNNECVPKKPVCEIKDDKYYDDEGKETSKEEYEKKCKKIKCEYRDHQYYDLNGEATTKEEYDKQCKKHYCEVIDHTYYDKNGNVVNKTTYEASCKKNICVIVNGKYYDKKGNEVSKGEYENSCVSVPIDNPPTGAETPYIALLGGLVVSGTIFYETKKKKNCFYSIK